MFTVSRKKSAVMAVVRGCVDGRVPVFGSAAWVLAAWRHLPELGSPAVLEIADRPGTWLLPLSVRRCHEAVTISLAGAPLGDAHGLLGAARPLPEKIGARTLDCLLEACGAGGSVELDALSRRDALGRALETGAGEWTVEREPSPVIAVTAVAVSSSHDKRWRRLGSQGRLAVQVAAGAELRGMVVEDFVRRRLARWRAQGRLDELGQAEHLPGFPCFLAQAASVLACAGQARLWRLLVDGQPAAQDLHLGPASAPLLYMRDYDLRFAPWSAGRLLLETTLLRLRAAGVATLETGRGDEPYKLKAGGDGDYVLNARAARR
jgi:CelD/BcsL family acetyltransferase involved in cellulose biosynthesis